MRFLERHPMYMIAVGVIGISLSAIIVRYSDAPSIVTAAYRLFWSVALMAPAVFLRKTFRRELFSADRRTLALCALSGVFLALHFITWFESLRCTSVASSTVIVCTESLWVALGYRFLMRGKISGRAMAAMLLSFSGSILIALSDYGRGGSQLAGDLLALFAAVMVAAYTLLGRTVRSTTSTTVYTFVVYSFCALALTGLALLSGTPLSGYGFGSVRAGFLLAVFSTLLGHSVFSWCLKYLSPAFVSSSKLCEPVIASLFAIILFGEIPSPLQCAGGIVILGGVIWYSGIEQKGESGAPRPHA